MSGLFARIFHRKVGGVLPGEAAWFRRRQPPPQNAARPQNNKIPQGKTANRAQKILKKFRANFVQTVDKQKKIWYYFYCF